MTQQGATPDEINTALSQHVKGDLPEGANITKAIVGGYTDGLLIGGTAYLGPAVSVGKVVGGAVIAEIANGSYQWFDLSKPGNENKSWNYKGSIASGITGALAPGRSIQQNVGVAGKADATAVNAGKVPKNPNSSSAITDSEAGAYYDKFKNADGGWNWPKNLGFEGNPVKTTIPVGTRLDRYGEPSGSFLAPKRTPYEQRALAPGAKAEKYYEYEVIKPLPAIQGKIAPAFGEPGGGIQILPNMQDRVNVEWLLKNEYIREVR